MQSETTLNTRSEAMAGSDAPVGVTLTILWHPEPARIGAMAALDPLQARRDGVSRTTPRFDDGAPLLDKGCSRAPVRLRLDRASCRFVADRAGLKFTVDGLPRADHVVAQLDPGAVLRLGGRGPIVHVRRGVHTRDPDDLGLVGPSAHLAHVRATIRTLGPTPYPVLIRGLTGTGKELVAQALHQLSGRPGALVPISLAALPETTAASQLFGHAKGAFTGADRRSLGYFGQAEGGTLFLDEVGASSLALQALLLRALESQQVQPIGSTPRHVDVRIVSATDEDLERAIDQGRFRRPLLHRLAHGTLQLAPLRDRPTDVAAQFVHFATAAAGPLPTGWLARHDLERLLAHPWPGNTRELRSVAEQSTLGGPTCTLPDLHSPHAPAPIPSPAPDILAVLRDHRWQIRPAADALGMARNTLKRRMEELGVTRAVDLDPALIQRVMADRGSVGAAAMALRVSEVGLRRRIKLLGLPLSPR